MRPRARPGLREPSSRPIKVAAHSNGDTSQLQEFRDVPVAAAVEFVLEGLHLTRRLSKVQADGQTIYGS